MTRSAGGAHMPCLGTREPGGIVDGVRPMRARYSSPGTP